MANGITINGQLLLGNRENIYMKSLFLLPIAFAFLCENANAGGCYYHDRDTIYEANLVASPMTSKEFKAFSNFLGLEIDDDKLYRKWVEYHSQPNKYYLFQISGAKPGSKFLIGDLVKIKSSFPSEYYVDGVYKVFKELDEGVNYVDPCDMR